MPTGLRLPVLCRLSSPPRPIPYTLYSPISPIPLIPPIRPTFPKTSSISITSITSTCQRNQFTNRMSVCPLLRHSVGASSLSFFFWGGVCPFSKAPSLEELGRSSPASPQAPLLHISVYPCIYPAYISLFSICHSYDILM